MRRFLSQSAPSRDKNYKGGIKYYAIKMGEIGKFSKQLKLVDYVAFASDLVSAVATIAMVAGKATGDITGWIAGETYDAINDYQSK